MRWTSRVLAAAKTARFLEPNTPTGLTGLFTHASPRATLIYLYTSSLEKLKAFPEDSVYRKSTEALTKQRLGVIQSVRPAGWDEYVAQSKAFLAEHPEVLNRPASGLAGDPHRHVSETVGAQGFIHTNLGKEYDVDRDEWDGEVDDGPVLEGVRTSAERKDQGNLGDGRHVATGSGGNVRRIQWEGVAKEFSGSEPALDADQISDIENRIGAGLIEEVIQVAEGELKLIDTMAKAKVWEDLEEKPVDGQWSYFMRDTGSGKTQPPPQK